MDKSLRLNEGKIQTRELDPNFILAMGEVLTLSRSKYEHFNWTKATDWSTPYESMMRHLMAFQKGENVDPDDGCSHLAKAAVNLMFLHYYVHNYPHLDDRKFTYAIDKKQKP